jgi:iron(III) transport system substrate-binding protein
MVVLSSEDSVSGKVQFFWILIVLACGCRPIPKAEVIVYTSQDQTYAEPILQRFSAETGIEVKAVYDSESVKTVGLVNRLRAEINFPQCDVFWNNEESLTRILEADGVLRETNGWVSVGCRTRRLVYHTAHITSAQLPKSLLELTNAEWRGKVALAYPLFGTTASHFAALRQKWGEKVWLQWCEGLVANQAFLVDGNSVVVKLVGKGEAWLGLTDSDDIAAGQHEGMPIASAPLSSDFLPIPNTIAIIKGAPHREAAEKLFQFLQSKETLEALVKSSALESATPPGGLLAFDAREASSGIEERRNSLKKIFLR